MGRQWNSDSIPETTMFDSGPYLFTVESLEEGQTRAGTFAYKARLRCVEGKTEFISAAKFETFTMGTPEDPEWQDPNTVGPGARGFKNFLKGLGLDVTHPDVDELIAQAVGSTVGGIVNKALDKQGVMRDNIDRWYPAAPPATPVTAAKPVARVTTVQKANPAPVTAPAAAPVARAKPVETAVKCGVCNESVPRSQFGAHVQQHES